MSKLSSGRAVGEKVPQFYTRAITGPLMNKSVCYVCRNGDRPVVMVFLRRIAPGLPQLLKRLDKHVDQHRADGLRGFAVMISDEDRQATSALQTLAFEHKLSLPLTLSPLHVGLPGNQNIHEEAVVTVVLYRDQQVTHSHAFREADLTAERTEEVFRDLKQLLATEPMAQAAR